MQHGVAWRKKVHVPSTFPSFPSVSLKHATGTPLWGWNTTLTHSRKNGPTGGTRGDQRPNRVMLPPHPSYWVLTTHAASLRSDPLWLRLAFRGSCGSVPHDTWPMILILPCNLKDILILCIRRFLLTLLGFLVGSSAWYFFFTFEMNNGTTWKV